MNSISIKEVHSATDLRRFIAFPYSLYKDSPQWVAPLYIEQKTTLNPKSNPFFQHGKMQLFLALDQDGNVIGRIAAIINTLHLEKYKDGMGFFGFFECIDSIEAARLLIQSAANWLKAQGLTGMRGPVNPSMNDICGLLVKGFEYAPGFFMPYNPPYYESLLLQCGFERAMTMYSYYFHRHYLHYGEVDKWVKEASEHFPNLTMQPLEQKNLTEEIDALLGIYNKSLDQNWGHVPMTEAEFRSLIKFARHLVEPELVCFLEDQGKRIGFFLAVPDFNEVLRHRRDGRLLPLGWLDLFLRWKFGGIRTVRAAMGGVLPEYRGHGLAMILALLAAKANWLSRYDGVEFSWILETNKLFIDTLEHLGAVRQKEYAIYDRHLV